MTLSRLATSALYERYTPAGIAGYGGWASVTATTGSPETGTYNDGTVDWVYYKWTGDGSVTTTAGLVDVLVVSGGGGSSSTLKGNGGRIATGLHQLAASTHSIKVGRGGVRDSNPTGTGDNSALGSIVAASSGVAYNNDHATGAGGTGSAAADTAKRDGHVSSITGTSVTYARGMVASPVANTGDGGDGSAGANGVVIIRVPVNPELWGAPPAQGVLPNLGVGWASVTAASGTFTKGSYTDSDGQWTYWKWTGNGSVTTTDGLTDLLVCGAGGLSNGGSDAGYGGDVIDGLHNIGASTHSIVVRAANASNQGPRSELGSLHTGDAGKSSNLATGARGDNNFGNWQTGVTSSITGTSVEYGRAGDISAPGGGGRAGINEYGTKGAVIVRVPTAFDLT